MPDRYAPEPTETADQPASPTASRESSGDPPGTLLKPESDVSPPAPITPVPKGNLPVLGRYRLTRELGRGGFGVVYLGTDDVLQREVAVKVPRPDLFASADQAEQFLAEARLVARMEHPAILRVYDCGRTDDGRCYVVSQFVPGGDLADYLRNRRPSPAWAARIVGRLADALHCAHEAKIVHRDVKPSNVLLDGDEQPFLADFGLALREQDFGRGGGLAGTPRYMSPEQARGEGHRVDGRCDVYSLGVVLYEMLAGRPPFAGSNISELIEQIQLEEPPSLRGVEGVSRELARVCHRAMAKRVGDRYPTAAVFADELRHWLANSEAGRSDQSSVSAVVAVTEVPASPTPTSDDMRPARVVPKGLRAFDAADADFFLRLLPGPRDRDGLPDSLRFWKSHLDQRDATRTFAVGLVYGPSGCGKTSFLRAGLLPRLASGVTAVYVEATPGDTEARLLDALRRRLSDVPRLGTLADALTALRRQPRGKVVMVIDQFEQWLFAHPATPGSELVRALRQCDGGAVQAIVAVRDDFWMAATRFFRDLEVPLREGHNSAAVDLFDRDHARRVLTAFGRAYGKLPAKRDDLTDAQKQFLDRAVDWLADSGRVVCVRLVLFAEMVKDKPWEPVTLDAVGDFAGVGVAFLEETFTAAGAPPAHRAYQAAARGILKALLPPEGSDIKAALVPRPALVAASGCADRPADFDAVLDILNGELRLVTPADTAGIGGADYYQLTHDYLVPSLRLWLTRQQRETRRGRAEILLAERAALWRAKPYRRLLLSLPEWLRVWRLTRPRDWSADGRALMTASGRAHGLRAGVAVVLIALLGWLGWHYTSKQWAAVRQARAELLVEQVASDYKLPDIVDRMAPYSDLVEPMLDDAIGRATDRKATRLLLVKILVVPHAVPTAKELKDILNVIPPPLFGRFIAKLRARPDVAIAVFDQFVQRPPTQLVQHQLPNDRRQFGDAAKRQLREVDDGQRSLAVVALYQFGRMEPLWPRLGSTPTNDQRARLIHDLAALGSDPSPLVQRLQAESNSTARSALYLALGEFGNKVDDATRAALLPKLLDEYRGDPDPGVHAALDWLLRQRWGLAKEVADIDAKLAGNPAGRRQWSINSQRQTFVHIRRPSAFEMGAAPEESDRKSDANRHQRRIGRPFAIGLREVTAIEFNSCFPNHKFDPQYVPSGDCPAVQMNWHQAAVYCNWLSARDGIPADQHCYDIDEKMTATPKIDHLKLTGYRLPTEAEWEYAARAGATASRYYGTADDLLGHYAWHANNARDRTHPVGQLKPNALGLFDALGNAMEWTVSVYDNTTNRYPEDATKVYDDEEPAAAGPDANRVLRGAPFYAPPPDVRCARRYAVKVTTESSSVGFRVVRTLPPE